VKQKKYMRIKGADHLFLNRRVIKENIMEQEMEQRLWDYIDGTSQPAEKTAVSQLISEDPVWKLGYEELVSIQAMLQKEDLEMPPLRFTKNVMEEIAKYQVAPATKSYINKNVIRGIMAFFLVMLTGLIIYLLGEMHWTNHATNSLIPGFSSEAEKFNIGKVLSNAWVNIFIGINATLGLILIDTYMQGKRKADQPSR
jgi:hypothetical protein